MRIEIHKLNQWRGIIKIIPTKSTNLASIIQEVNKLNGRIIFKPYMRQGKRLILPIEQRNYHFIKLIENDQENTQISTK